MDWVVRKCHATIPIQGITTYEVQCLSPLPASSSFLHDPRVRRQREEQETIVRNGTPYAVQCLFVEKTRGPGEHKQSLQTCKPESVCPRVVAHELFTDCAEHLGR